MDSFRSRERFRWWSAVGRIAAALIACGAAAARAQGDANHARQPLPDVALQRPPACEGADCSELREPEGPLALEAALAIALAASPDLAASASEVRAREAAVSQAKLRPNPQFVTQVENFGGSGRMRGFSGSETTVALEQRIELAGKRGKRVALADVDRALASWDHEARRLDLLAEVRVAFLEVLAAQERVALAREFLQISRTEDREVQRRVEAGAASALDRKHAQVAVATGVVEQELAARKLALARNELAAAWGASEARFSEARGDFWTVEELPLRADLERSLGRAPEIARWESELEQRRDALALEEAARVPDLEMNAGFRHLGDESANALVFEMRVPLPLFDRNQGGIRQSRLRFDQGMLGRTSAVLRARRALGAAYERLAASRYQVTALRSDVLPLAQTAFESAREGYRMGRFRPLEVSDAQRTLYELRGRHIEALLDYHAAQAELARVAGSPDGASQGGK